MSNEIDLIRLSQAGNRRAQDALLKMHEAFLNCVARRYRIPGCEYDDLMQLARIGLLEAIRLFDPKRECKLLTLAIHRIRKHFHHELVPHKAKKRIGTTLSFEDIIPNTTLTISETISANEDDPEIDFEQLSKAISGIKKESEKTVMKIIFNGLVADEYVNLQEIGDQMNGISRERVRQIKCKAIQSPAFKRIRQELFAA